jgi:ubiquinone/menaquinone biosynthesis C-methylase UbiE
MICASKVGPGHFPATESATTIHYLGFAPDAGAQNCGEHMSEGTSLFIDGQAYERLMGRWSRAAGEVFLDWLSLPKGLNWLDVGCGTGAFTELVIDRCAPSNISAIDPAVNQIAYARNGPAAKRATFRTGDAQSLPFADREFDVAAMALVLRFVPDAAKAVAEMKRVVKPQGTVAAYMWDAVGGGFVQRPLVEALGAMGIDVPPATGRKNSRIDEMRGLFERAGLDQVATRTIEIEVSYPNFDDYWSAQTGLANPVVQAIREMFEPDVVRLQAYLRERLATDHGGRIAYPARANAVKGCRESD